MTATQLVDRLAEHRLLADAPREQLEWLAARGVLLKLEAGGVLTARGVPVQGVFIVLAGDLSISVDRGTGPHRLLEWHAGDITGLLPYSRLVTPPGDVRADSPAELLMIAREEIPALIRDCYDVTSILVHVMVDRARVVTTSDLQEEKMASLGKLAAGLAHELNNPASAVARSADALGDRLAQLERSARAIGALHLTEAQQSAVERVHELSLVSASATAGSSSLEQADREDEISSWLERRHANVTAAYSLAESSITLDALDELAESLEGPALETAVRWLVASGAVRQLTAEIEAAATRIHKLVSAVKGFTYMDQATSPKPVEVQQGLTDTLAVLNGKARERSVAIRLEVEPDLPRVTGFGGELNQVWANVIDNALDAARQQVTITAQRAGQSVVVRVTDDGAGIPAEIRDRIFDPFFTTKPVGQGAGLGLDVARRLVRHHRGEVGVESAPGRTQFSVTLPIETGIA